MPRRSVALGLTALTLVAAAASAALLLGDAPRVALTSAASEADHVTLYQNGLAAVELTRSFESVGGTTMLSLSLPTTARFDSLQVDAGDGAIVRELRSSLSASGSLQPGEQVALHVEGNRTFEGTFLGLEEGSLRLASGSGVTLVQAGKVVAIEVAGQREGPSAPGSVEATVLVDAPPGNRTVRVSYLAFGAGWTPSYELDLDAARLTFFGTLVGLDDWRNVTLDLVSGAPRLVLQPRPVPGPVPMYASRLVMDESAKAGATADVAASSVPVGELHRFRLDGPVDLRRGETLRVAIESGTIDVARHYLEAAAGTGWGMLAGERQDVQVSERLTLRNSLAEPLPPGIVRAYRDGTWVGEDSMQALARNETTNLTLAFSEDVTARLVLERHDAQPGLDRATYAMTVTNRKAEPVDLRAALSIPTYRTTVTAIEPAPAEQTGAQVAWDRTLAPGESATFRVSYETQQP